MQLKTTIGRCALAILAAAYAGALLPDAKAASCTTQSQMAAPLRDMLAGAARTIVAQVQSGDVQALRTNTIPQVAADFGGIAASAASLKPLIQSAAITVDDVYALDASTEPVGAPQTDFYCGSPVVALNFTGLPPGTYALAILHATGVPQPQQVALILAKTGDNRWMLAGFFSKPMTEAGHDGLWYWVSARKYAQTNGNWGAWFYYRLAAQILDPVEFLSSSNLDKLHHEADAVKPQNLPDGSAPVTLAASGSSFALTTVDTTTALGPLDLDVHYTPNPTQAAQLRDPPAARGQMIAVMTALLAQHPELRTAFHGMWVHADQGNATLFALELPMGGIAGGQQPLASSKPVSR
ncbi:MAG: hypothetical protein WBE76_15390 [Terracidiphilus sp.]